MSKQFIKKYLNGTQFGMLMSKLSTPFFMVVALLLFTMLLGACSPEEIPPTLAQSVSEATAVAAELSTAVPTDLPVPPTATLELEPTVAPTATVESTATVEPTPEPTPTATMLPPLSGSGGGVIAYISEPNGIPSLHIMNADGTEQRQLAETFDDDPTWSPDGQQIAFQSDTKEEWGLYSIDLLSGEIKLLNRREFGDGVSNADWSPDGKHFAVNHGGDTFTEKIFLLNADDDGMRQIIESPNHLVDFESPDWSPDGKQLVFSSFNNAEEFNIYIADADGSNLVQLLNNSDANVRYPAWSPDGTKIAFESKADGNWDIFTMNLDGSDLQNITNSPGSEWWPTWSPDSTKIAFQSKRDGNWEIYVMNADGTDVQRITDNSYADSMPAWRP